MSVAPRPVSLQQLPRALELVAYALARRPDDYRVEDPITALEHARLAAGSLPAIGAPLREAYPALVELAVRSLVALGSMPEPSEVDGLLEFGGFELWRDQR